MLNGKLYCASTFVLMMQEKISGEASIDYHGTLTWMKMTNPYSRVCLKKSEPVAIYCPGNEQEMYLHEYDAQVQDAIRNCATKLVIMFTIYN